MEKFVHNAFDKKYGFDKINDRESLNERLEKTPSAKTSLKESTMRKINPTWKILNESADTRYFISVPVGAAGTTAWKNHPKSTPNAPDPFSGKVLKYNKNGEFVLSARTKRQALERMIVFASKNAAQTFLDKLKKTSPDIAYIENAIVSPRGTTVEDVSEEKVDTDLGVISILHINKNENLHNGKRIKESILHEDEEDDEDYDAAANYKDSIVVETYYFGYRGGVNGSYCDESLFDIIAHHNRINDRYKYSVYFTDDFSTEEEYYATEDEAYDAAIEAITPYDGSELIVDWDSKKVTAMCYENLHERFDTIPKVKTITHTNENVNGVRNKVREIDLTESPADLMTAQGSTACFLSKNIDKVAHITNPMELKLAVMKMIEETDEITSGNKQKTLYMLEKTPTRAILSTIGTMISGLKV